MDIRDLQDIATRVQRDEQDVIDAINAETVISYINNQLENAANQGKTIINLSYTYQPMKKMYEDSKITGDVESHFVGRGFSVRLRSPDNTEPYIEISF